MKQIIRITENELYSIIRESVNKILTENTGKFLYHKAPIAFRDNILKNGLIPSVGASYKAHWDDTDNLTPCIFLYDHAKIRDGEYDSTYDDDIYQIDMSQLNTKYLHNDPDTYMVGSLVYLQPIPPSAIKLIYQGSDNDSGDLRKHRYIYESVNQLDITIEEANHGDEIAISLLTKDQEELGFATLYVHHTIGSLYSIISDTDSDDTAFKITQRLNPNKPIIEIADVHVNTPYRQQGLSNMLINHILNKYNGNQFYLRVCPEGGVDEMSYVNSFKKHGFVGISSTDENGTFMIRE